MRDSVVLLAFGVVAFLLGLMGVGDITFGIGLVGLYGFAILSGLSLISGLISAKRKAPSKAASFLLLLGIAAAGFQSPSAEAGFGVHGGAVWNSFNYNNPGYVSINPTQTNPTNWMAGLHWEGFAFADFFALRIETNWMEKGYSLANIATVTHNYIQVPALIKFTPFIGPIGIFAEGGAAYSFHVHDSVDVNGVSTSYNDGANNNDWEWLAGAGVNIKFDESFVLEAEARYDWGMHNLSNIPGVDIKSRALEGIAGVTFLFH